MLRKREEPQTIRKKSFEVRLQWFGLLDKVRSKHIRLIVEDSGRDAAILISMDEYKYLCQYNDEVRKHIA